MGRTFLLAHGLALAAFHAAFAADDIRLSEVHYHPQGPEEKEFIELHNAGTAPADLIGWSFSDGVRYSFARSTVIPPGGFLVVTGDEFDGRLDDSGERIALADASGRLVEELTYRDTSPFHPEADGGGASLARLCFDAPAGAPFNWRAETPTPGAPRAGAELCPPAPLPADPEAFPIVINEIHYHPRGTPEPPLEFVELLNRSSTARDVSGWVLDRGAHFTFPAGTTIPPGGLAVVAQDPDALAAQQGIERARLLGPFEDGTNLSNSGERLRIVDASQQVQDEVEYADDGSWPSLADGLGPSLQRVDPLGPSSAPGNWRAARPPAPGAGGEWREFRVEGPHEGTRLYLYLADAGEILIDAVSLEVKDSPGVNALPDGEFTAGLGAWAGLGNHSGTVAEATGGFGDGGPCARVKATGPGNGGQNGVRVTLSAVPPKGAHCILTIRVKPVNGESRFTARSSSATLANGLIYLQGDARTGDDGSAPTPLGPNGASESSTPPTIERLETVPAWPTSRDPVVLRARVTSSSPAVVVASHQVGAEAAAEVALRDDGAPPDELAGDGWFSGTIPPAPDGSLVWVSVRAASAGGAVSYFPPWRNPSPVTGYLVEDDLPAQNEDLRLFHIFTPGALLDLSCNDRTYTRGDFVDFRGRAYRGVGVKFRGETACGYPKKPMRVEFQKGDLLDRQRHLNFNACWNDKSIIREQMAFDFFRDAGCGYSEAHFASVHTKAGAFHGAYFTIEDPDEQYLKRNRLRSDGGFYKCRTAMLSGGPGGYEPRTDASQARLTAVSAFATDLNRLSGQALIDFLVANLDVEGVIDYQAVQDIIIDGDSVVKNWLLYYGRPELAGPGQDLFTMLAWDCDLTYGQMLLTTDVRNYDIHPLFQTATYPFYDQGYHGILTALLQKAPGDFFVKAFYGRIWHLLQDKMSPTVIGPKVDRFDANTRDAGQADLKKWPRSWGARGTDLAYWRNDHRTFLGRRFDYLTRYITALNVTTQGRKFQYKPAPSVKLTEIHYNPPGQGSALEFVEVTNLEGSDVGVASWDIPILGFTFPPGALLHAGESALVAKDPALLRARFGLDGVQVFGPYALELGGGGAIVRLRDDGEGGKYYPETIDVVAFEDRKPWPEAADGGGKSLELAGLGLDNDLPSSWRAGWSPGRAAPEDSPPVAAIDARSTGAGSSTFLLSALGSTDADGDSLAFEWTFPPEAGPPPSDSRAVVLRSFPVAGTYRVNLVVRDGFGGEGRAAADIVVGDAPEPRFLRGDSNGDGGADITDAIVVLNYLFLGGAGPGCADAADTDDDGVLGITDAIYLLAHLFTGGPAPPAPFPGCGVDASGDALEACHGQGACG